VTLRRPSEQRDELNSAHWSIAFVYLALSTSGQLAGELVKTVISALSPSILNRNILAFLVAKLAKAYSHRIDKALVLSRRKKPLKSRSGAPSRAAARSPLAISRFAPTAAPFFEIFADRI
jgi:hypothetical protein